MMLSPTLQIGEKCYVRTYIYPRYRTVRVYSYSTLRLPRCQALVYLKMISAAAAPLEAVEGGYLLPLMANQKAK